MRLKSSVIKKLSEVIGKDFFMKEGFSCNEVRAYKLTAMAMYITNSIGMYKIPGEKSDMILCLQKKLASTLNRL